MSWSSSLLTSGSLQQNVTDVAITEWRKQLWECVRADGQHFEHLLWVVGCWCGCLGWGADLHIAHQMPLPLTISCSSKSRLVLTFLVLPFWYLLTEVVPDIFQKSSKTVVCVCVCVVSFSQTNKVRLTLCILKKCSFTTKFVILRVLNFPR